MVVLDVCKKKSDGNILIATYGNGVCEVSPDGSTRKLYSTADGTLRDDHVYRLSYDKAGIGVRLYLTTANGDFMATDISNKSTAKGNGYWLSA